MHPVNLKLDYAVDPVGTDNTAPAFSWELVSAERSRFQSAYRVLVASSKEKCVQGVGDIWDSGKRDSNRANGVRFDGSPLKSARKYWWSVNVWDQNDNESGFAEPAHFITGIMDRQEWRAKWIGVGPENNVRVDFSDCPDAKQVEERCGPINNDEGGIILRRQ
jgi:alpha-L-rhamnosidase